MNETYAAPPITTKHESEQINTLIAWLNDAHAMERALVVVFEKQAKDTEGIRGLHSRIVAHLEETKGHAEKIEECIRRNGGDLSIPKDVGAQMGAVIGGLSISMWEDSIVKNLLKSYSAEHFEIASYLAIRAAALEVGDVETADVCNDILQDEVRMAEWLREHISLVVAKHMADL